MRNKSKSSFYALLYYWLLSFSVQNLKSAPAEPVLESTQKSMVNENNPALINKGREIFRFDSFGDEGFWTGLLHLDKAILGAANGGYGRGRAHFLHSLLD